jgi:hypothetical protein
VSWVIALVIGAAGLLYVAAPLARPRADRDGGRGLIAELAARKRAALLGIVDLEGERAVGKLNDEDFIALKSEYEAEALVAIAELDQLDAPGEDLEHEIADLRFRLADGDSV